MDLFDFPVFNNDNIAQYSPDEIFIDASMVQNSFTFKPYEYFLPSITFHFEKSPSQIDFDQIIKLLGDEIIIINVQKGSTFLKVAFITSNEIPEIKKKFESVIKSIKDKLVTSIGKSIIGNLIEEPEIKFPSDEKIQEFYKRHTINLLQNTIQLESIEFDEIKNEVYRRLGKENAPKNWSFIFKNYDLFEAAEKQVREDISKCPNEVIIVGQTIIANKYLEEYENNKKQIPEENLQEVFLYHGTRLSNHQKIVKEHFIMPVEMQNENNNHTLKPDQEAKNPIPTQTDDGYYGKGIYATENIYYASMYANGCRILKFGEKASVICCKAFFNTSSVQEINDLERYGTEIPDDVKSSFGINLALVGSSKRFYPINEDDIDKNYIYANEFVFPNKYQIIPICSFTVMAPDHFILWKSENMHSKENTDYIKYFSEIINTNIYFKDKVEDALEVVNLKKRNAMKLITNAGSDSSG